MKEKEREKDEETRETENRIAAILNAVGSWSLILGLGPLRSEAILTNILSDREWRMNEVEESISASLTLTCFSFSMFPYPKFATFPHVGEYVLRESKPQ